MVDSLKRLKCLMIERPFPRTGKLFPPAGNTNQPWPPIDDRHLFGLVLCQRNELGLQVGFNPVISV
jgi:hypothetical protein